MIHGHCECGSIQYETNAEANDFSHCHCSQCRRLHGAAFASFIGVPKASLRYLGETGDLTTYESSPGHDRLFCANCGSNILVTVESEPDVVYLALGTVDGNPALPPGYHIYAGSKAPWHEITDDLPQFDTDP